MRVALLTIILGLATTTLPVAAQAVEDTYHLNIPRQPLDDALKDLAQQTGLQIARFSDTPGGGSAVGPVAGDMSVGKALAALLVNSGLTYKVVNDRTIAVITPGAAAAASPSVSSSNTTQSSSPDAGDSQREGKKNSSDTFRVAQASPGPASGTSSLVSQGGAADNNAEPGLQEIVVTASKRTETLSKVGASVSVVSGQMLEDRSANSLQDYLQFLPGVSLQSSGAPGNGIVSIRGVAPQSVGTTTATYIDGVPFGPTSALTENAFFTLDLNPTDLDRVEVLKGPQGTLYGASSMGGLIKYVTRAPDLNNYEFRASEDFNQPYGGGFGTKLGAAVSAPLVPGELGVRLNYYYVHEGGYIDDIGYGGENTNRSNDWGFHGGVLFQPFDALTIRLNAILQNTSLHGQNVVDVNLATYEPQYGGWSQLRYAPEPFTNSIRLYSAEINYNFGKVNLVSDTSYSSLNPDSYSDLTGIYRAVGPPFSNYATPGTAVWGYADFPSHKVTEELRLVSQRMGAVEWILGGFFQHEDVTDNVNVGQVTLPELTQIEPLQVTFREGTLTEYAAYGDVTIYLAPSFDITGGMRNSHISQTSYRGEAGLLNNPTDPTQYITAYQEFSEVSNTYLASARWRITDDLLWYVRAASGYRPGGGRTIPPGAPPDYKDYYLPDSLWNYESGLKLRTLDGHLTLDGDVFWINWNNIQTLVPLPGSFIVNDGNAGTAVSRGAELAVNYIPVQGVTLGANGTFTQAKFTETVPGVATNGEPLFYIPKFTATAYGEYSRPLGRGWSGFVGGDYQYTDTRLDTNRTSMPAYSIVNLHVGARDAHYRVNLYVNNLFDNMAFLGYSNGGFGAPYGFAVNQVRTIGVTLSQTF